MREILFRGKRIDNGEWVEGGIDTDWGVSAAERERYWIDRPYLGKISVIPETVGQYTGLTDKNGTMIFEGDIVTVLPECEEGVIEWDNESARFVVIMDGVLTDFDNCWDKDLEVTRTVHDVPETLKGW